MYVEYQLAEATSCPDPCTQRSSDSVEQDLHAAVSSGDLGEALAPDFQLVQFTDSVGRSSVNPSAAPSVSMIVGVVIGVILLLAAIVLVVFLIVRGNRMDGSNAGRYTSKPSYTKVGQSATFAPLEEPSSSYRPSSVGSAAPAGGLRAVLLQSVVGDASQSTLSLAAGSQVSLAPSDYNPESEWTWVVADNQGGYVPTSFLRVASFK